MMEEALNIDATRWATLLQSVRDSRYSLRGANQQLGEAQERWMAAQAVRDRCAADSSLHYGSTPDIAAAGERNLAAAEERLAASRVELQRVQARVSALSEVFSRQTNLVEACMAWGRAHGLVLPDADSSSVQAVPPTTPTHGVDNFSFAVEATVASMAASAPSAGPAAGPPGPGLLERIGSALGLGGAA
jgi:hypothetical protein